MSKFKIGDKVKVDYDATIYEITNQTPGTDMYHLTDLDSTGKGVMRIRSEKELKLVSSTSNNGVLTIGKFMGKKIIISELKECLHEFKEYFGLGLFEPFQYCTKCDQKRNIT